MTLRARASRVAVAALLLGMGFGLGGLGPPAPGAGQPADECCYQVPSGSMKPTLFPHDRIGLAKYPQGTLPRAGDVIAFKLAKPGSPIYVKRAIGFAGDKVQLSRGVLDINGKSAKRERLADFVDEDEGGKHFRRWREILPNGVSYETIDLSRRCLPVEHLGLLRCRPVKSSSSAIIARIRSTAGRLRPSAMYHPISSWAGWWCSEHGHGEAPALPVISLQYLSLQFLGAL